MKHIPVVLTAALFTLGFGLGRTLSAHASVDIAVSPPYLEFEVGKQARTQSLNLINFSDKPVKVRVSIYNWTLDEANKVKLLPPTEQSLDQWVILNPLEFTIPGKGQQTVRLGVRPRVQPQAGEHRAIIYFDTAPAEAPTGAILVKGRLGVAAYGSVGSISRVGVLNGVTVAPNQKAPQAVFDITSTGTNHVRMSGQYAIWPAAQFPGAQLTKEIPNLNQLPKTLKKGESATPSSILEAGFLPSLPVLPQARRQLPLQFQTRLPPGKYVLDINGKLGDVALDQAIPFVINP